jgi:hypothetical protein
VCGYLPPVAQKTTTQKSVSTTFTGYYIAKTSGSLISEMKTTKGISHSKFSNGEPGSSVSIVSGYGLDGRSVGRSVEVRSTAEVQGFFL